MKRFSKLFLLSLVAGVTVFVSAAGTINAASTDSPKQQTLIQWNISRISAIDPGGYTYYIESSNTKLINDFKSAAQMVNDEQGSKPNNKYKLMVVSNKADAKFVVKDNQIIDSNELYDEIDYLNGDGWIDGGEILVTNKAVQQDDAQIIKDLYHEINHSMGLGDNK
ncbi:hypothetical protein [Companilactobacillus mishanensis]|uniref:hypothetical protein n=1 Tax=Companilactobacillus mishanensis TaxID=2486008 RepID=UPI000F7703A2|nr:hypothetical protein [Companilactobacillus mishanensis]